MRKLGTFKHNIRQEGRQLLNDHVSILIVDVVSQVQLQHIVDALGVCDIVGEHLAAGKSVVVDTDAVDVDGAVVGTDAYAHRLDLAEVVVGGILYRAAHDAVDVGQDQAVVAPLLDDEGHANVLIFLELEGDGALLGRQGNGLGGHRKTATTRETAQYGGIIVHDVPGGELNLYRFAGPTEVGREDGVRYVDAGITGDPQNRIPIRVVLPTIRGEVEAGQLSIYIARFPLFSIRRYIRSSMCGQIQRQGLRLGLNVEIGLVYLNEE